MLQYPHIIACFLILSRGFFQFSCFLGFSVVLRQADEEAEEGAGVEGEEGIEVAVPTREGARAHYEKHRQKEARKVAVSAEKTDKEQKEHPHKLDGIAKLIVLLGKACHRQRRSRGN